MLKSRTLFPTYLKSRTLNADFWSLFSCSLGSYTQMIFLQSMVSFSRTTICTAPFILFILKRQGHFTFTSDNAGKEGKKDASTMKHIQHNYFVLNLTSVLEITGVLVTGGPPTYKLMIQIYFQRFTFAGKHCQCCAFPDGTGVHLQCIVF